MFRTADLVEAAAEWPGDHGQFAACLVATSFLDELDDGYLEVHDYWDHAPDYVKARKRKEDQRRRRGGPTSKARDRHEKFVTVTNNLEKFPSPAPAPAPNEEECRERSMNATPPADSIMEFPVKGTPGTWYLTQAKRDEWHETYGDLLNVDRELKRARQWLVDNPTKKKTAKGMPKFLSGWLARENDKGGRGGTAQAEPPPDDPELAAFLARRRAAS